MYPVTSLRVVRVAFAFVLALVAAPGLLGAGTAAAQRGEVESDPVVIESVCVSRYTGTVRDATNGCSSSEVLVTLPGDPPASFCASNYTGVLRYAGASATCRSHETALAVDSESAAIVCISRYTGVLRAASRTGTCQSHETLASLGSGVAPVGCLINDVEPNDNIAGAQDLDSNEWCLTQDVYITDSTTVPHITINGTGNETYDVYSFTVPSAGATGTFDIDFAWTDQCGESDPCDDLDSYLRLYDSEGDQLAADDDSPIDPGSEDSFSLDSFITYTFDDPGTYYIEVGGCCVTPVYDATTYQLHVSVEGHSVP